jgi:hypothetical protein
VDPHAATEYLQSAATTAAVGRLIYLGLGKRFRALTAYLGLLAIMNFLYAILDWNSVSYFYTYICLVPLDCIFSVLAVRELFSLVFKNYAGIRTVGRWSMYAGVTLATTASIIITKLSWERGAQGRSHSHFFYWEVSQRSIVFTLAVVIITILFVLSKYPLHLGRNTWISSAFFGALFLSEAIRLLIDSLAPKLHNPYVDWSESVFIALCLGSWAVFLRPETSQPAARVAFSTPHEDHLLKQLESLNQVMARAARR